MRTCEPLEVRRLLADTAMDVVSTPLAFEPNVGQSDGGAAFLARGSGYGLFLADAGQATLNLRGGGGGAEAARAAVLRMRPVGARPDARATGDRELSGRVNSFLGDQANWRSNIPTFAAVRYDDLYRGVDLVYYGTQ